MSPAWMIGHPALLNPLLNVNRKLLFILLVLILPVGGSYAQKLILDSVVMKDTLIESSFEVVHKPLRAGFEPMFGRGWYGTSGVIPDPMSQNGCDNFGPGVGKLYGLRLLAEIPFWGDNSPWTFEPTIYGKLHSATFDWFERAQGYESKANALTPFTVDHQLSASLDEVGIEGRMAFRLFEGFQVSGGASVGYVVHRRYEKSLHIVEAGNTFADGSRDSSVSSGVLVDSSVVLPNLSLALNYELPLSKKLRVQPSVEVTLPILGITNYWKGVQFTGGLSFLFDLTPRREVVPVFEKRQVPVIVERKRDSVVPQAPLTATIRAVAVTRDGDTSSVVRMKVEEVLTKSACPILNYIFFDEGSAQLPKRYVQYASYADASHQFQGSSERRDIKLMDLYHETLNILGDRLHRNTKATVTLLGSTSNTGREHNDLTLARSRANALKQYLVNVWSIDPKRIRVEASLLPTRQSPTNTEQGQEENRRVEFRVDDERLTDPITVTNIEHLATPDRIVLKPTIGGAAAGVLRTHTSISAGGVELISFRGDATATSQEKMWAPTEDALANLRDSLRLDYDVWDKANNHAHAENSVPLDVSRVTTQRSERVERFSLILFGFDESHLEHRNDRAIRKAAEMLPTIPVEHVLIQGFTDETGDSQHNDALSEERAMGVRIRLEEMLHEENVPLPNDMHTEGRGSRDLLYDNKLPEGRFFSRTVNITIQRSAK